MKFPAVKIEMLPTTINNLLEKAFPLFPKTPGAIILVFFCLVYHQYLFVAEERVLHETHEQAESGCPGAGYNVIIPFGAWKGI